MSHDCLREASAGGDTRCCGPTFLHSSLQQFVNQLSKQEICQLGPSSHTRTHHVRFNKWNLLACRALMIHDVRTRSQHFISLQHAQLCAHC